MSERPTPESSEPKSVTRVERLCVRIPRKVNRWIAQEARSRERSKSYVVLQILSRAVHESEQAKKAAKTNS